MTRPRRRPRSPWRAKAATSSITMRHADRLERVDGRGPGARGADAGALGEVDAQHEAEEQPDHRDHEEADDAEQRADQQRRGWGCRRPGAGGRARGTSRPCRRPAASRRRRRPPSAVDVADRPAPRPGSPPSTRTDAGQDGDDDADEADGDHERRSGSRWRSRAAAFQSTVPRRTHGPGHVVRGRGGSRCGWSAQASLSAAGAAGVGELVRLVVDVRRRSRVACRRARGRGGRRRAAHRRSGAPRGGRPGRRNGRSGPRRVSAAGAGGSGSGHVGLISRLHRCLAQRSQRVQDSRPGRCAARHRTLVSLNHVILVTPLVRCSASGGLPSSMCRRDVRSLRSAAVR